MLWQGHVQRVSRNCVAVGYGSESPSVVLIVKGGKEYRRNRVKESMMRHDTDSKEEIEWIIHT